jgi:Fe-S-cluster containining protein
MTDREFDCPRCGHCCPQRQWVGLTREDMAELRQAGLHSISDYAFEVIANFLKEKNGG